MIPRFAFVSTLFTLWSACAGCGEKTSSNPTASASVAVTTSARTSSAPERATPSATPPSSASARSTDTRTWSFDQDAPQEPPKGLEVFTTEGPPPAWLVAGHQFGHSAPFVVHVSEADAHDARATGVVTGPALRDARASVFCTVEPTRTDSPIGTPNPFSVCGLVVRFKDAKNHYLAAANAHDQDVSLYVVRDGHRTRIGGWKSPAMENAWHELTLEVKGDALAVSWDDKRVYEAHDKTFTEPGRVGIATYANSRAEFDDFTVTSL